MGIFTKGWRRQSLTGCGCDHSESRIKYIKPAWRKFLWNAHLSIANPAMLWPSVVMFTSLPYFSGSSSMCDRRCYNSQLLKMGFQAGTCFKHVVLLWLISTISYAICYKCSFTVEAVSFLFFRISIKFTDRSHCWRVTNHPANRYVSGWMDPNYSSHRSTRLYLPRLNDSLCYALLWR